MSMYSGTLRAEPLLAKKKRALPAVWYSSEFWAQKFAFFRSELIHDNISCRSSSSA